MSLIQYIFGVMAAQASFICSVFGSFSFDLSELIIYWDYGEAHNFNGSHDEVGSTIKHGK